MLTLWLLPVQMTNNTNVNEEALTTLPLPLTNSLTMGKLSLAPVFLSIR